MRILVTYCHPVETSYNAALHTQVVTSLRAHDHMNVATPPKLERFKQRVGQAMTRLA